MFFISVPQDADLQGCGASVKINGQPRTLFRRGSSLVWQDEEGEQVRPILTAERDGDAIMFVCGQPDTKYEVDGPMIYTGDTLIEDTLAYKLSAIADILRELARDVNTLYQTEKAGQPHDFRAWESVLGNLESEMDSLQRLYDDLPDAEDEPLAESLVATG